MYKFLSSKSYLLFLLLCVSFFGCEQLIEIIKPTHPKPHKESCRINSEGGKEFIYDSLSRLSRINNYQVTDPLIFEYNAQNQIVHYYVDTEHEGLNKVIAYDSLGRQKQIYDSSYGIEKISTLHYKPDTILIDYLARELGEEDTMGYYQTVLCFENEDLIRVYRLANETWLEGFDYTYSYTNTPNKIRDQKKKLALLLEDFTNPLMSKHLPLSKRNTTGADPGMITYSWLLNERLYPVNNGQDNRLYFDYECK